MVIWTLRVFLGRLILKQDTSLPLAQRREPVWGPGTVPGLPPKERLMRILISDGQTNPQEVPPSGIGMKLVQDFVLGKT
ncbi:hypothetical protein I79_015650 [Cricetulus griseus]|uniref:Uncharacterized protein n=1 Tax=Cricetulus griseus TaxID=10029 RepID=G3HXD0_CRIGR|nr:hypothetical protein I79_015650 [Cricetulus griseus]